MASKVVAVSKALQHATEMAELWQYRGNRAAERGDDELAERHYNRSQPWRDKMNQILESGVES